jgi:hypothetical protein
MGMTIRENLFLTFFFFGKKSQGYNQVESKVGIVSVVGNQTVISKY